VDYSTVRQHDIPYMKYRPTREDIYKYNYCGNSSNFMHRRILPPKEDKRNSRDGHRHSQDSPVTYKVRYQGGDHERTCPGKPNYSPCNIAMTNANKLRHENELAQ
jgi:hypothetical protein